MFGGPGGLAGLLNNPELMSSVTQMMQVRETNLMSTNDTFTKQNPDMRNMMSQIMQNFMGGQNAGAEAGRAGQNQGEGGANPLSDMLRAGEAVI